MSSQNIRALAAAMLCFAVLFAVCKAVLPGAAFVEAVVQLDHPDRLQVYYSGGGDFAEQYSALSGMIEPEMPQKAHIRLNHAPVRRLRLDLGAVPGTVFLRKLTVAGGYFAQDVVLGPEEIFRLFRVHSAGTTVRLEQDHVAVQTHEDSYIVCNEPLLQPDKLPLWSIPSIFAFFLFLLLQQTDIASLAPFADLRSKRPSVGENIDALDGLRGFALLLVVADHTWGFFSGAGRSGVWILMTLSGFLLAKPFVQQPERILSLPFLRHFFIRRIKRILPVYYSYILLVFILHGRLEEAALHFLFLKGNGHLWVVPQEICFYLLTPPALLLCLLLFRIRPWLVLPGLLGMIMLAKHFSKSVLLIGGVDGNIPLYFEVFLGGMLASWLHYGFGPHLSRLLRRSRTGGHGTAVAAILILLLFGLFSHERAWGGNRFFALIYYPWFAAAAAVLILAVLEAGASPLLRFLSSLPLRALSLVSFSMYIFHTLVIDVLRKGVSLYGGGPLTGARLFISTLLLSYLFACVTYALIERPFLRSL
ncbi:acyltransferase family protein [Candidatus Electronema sp. TJ]|uniref:acyltransferase family protein n=1 Tax=Candidatus Electronema sp. TJ TaxID=3401573 RepID=UPI003AA8673A